MIWIASSNIGNLSLTEGKGIPYAIDSSLCQAAPIPKNNLPLLRISNVAPIFAKTEGCLYTTPVMRVPSFILEVIPAERTVLSSFRALVLLVFLEMESDGNDPSPRMNQNLIFLHL